MHYSRVQRDAQDHSLSPDKLLQPDHCYIDIANNVTYSRTLELRSGIALLHYASLAKYSQTSTNPLATASHFSLITPVHVSKPDLIYASQPLRILNALVFVTASFRIITKLIIFIPV